LLLSKRGLQIKKDNRLKFGSDEKYPELQLFMQHLPYIQNGQVVVGDKRPSKGILRSIHEFQIQWGVNRDGSSPQGSLKMCPVIESDSYYYRVVFQITGVTSTADYYSKRGSSTITGYAYLEKLKEGVSTSPYTATDTD
jgi:hypothetical protein